MPGTVRDLLTYLHFGLAIGALAFAIGAPAAALPMVVAGSLCVLVALGLRAGSRLGAIPAALLALGALLLAALVSVGNVGWPPRTVALWTGTAFLLAVVEVAAVMACLRGGGKGER
jgi:hypothetical protein